MHEDGLSFERAKYWVSYEITHVMLLGENLANSPFFSMLKVYRPLCPHAKCWQHVGNPIRKYKLLKFMVLCYTTMGDLALMCSMGLGRSHAFVLYSLFCTIDMASQLVC